MKNKIMVGMVALTAILLSDLVLGERVLAQGNPGTGMPPGGMQRPANGQGGMKPLTPSTESISACTDKSEKDACSFSMTKTTNSSSSSESVTVSGACMKIPTSASSSSSTTSTELACVPARKDGERFANGQGAEPPSAGMSQNGNPQEPGEIDAKPIASSTEAQLQRAKEIKAIKVVEIDKIENRTEKMISFLESQNVSSDTADTIKSYLEVFKAKANILLAKYDAYITLLGDSSSADADKETAIESIKSAGSDMMAYFKGALRESIMSALDSLSD